jgi:photosystem II stability/assembly factor-like uncharacterized protein
VDALNGWAVGDTIIHTTDGGTTWTEQPVEVFDNYLTEVSFADASSGVVVGVDGIVYTTTDGGATWVNRQNGSPNDVLGMMALDTERAWATTLFGELEYTTDGGNRWNRVRIGSEFGHLYDVDFVDPLEGWVVGDGDQSDNHGVIYHSTDGGATWTKQFTGGYLTQLYGVEAVTRRVIVAVGNLGIIWRSTNGGQSWTQVPHPPITAVLSGVEFRGRVGYAVGNDAAVLRSADAGRTWIDVSPDAPVGYSLTDVSFGDSRNGWVVGFNQIVYRTTNGGRSWTEQTSGRPATSSLT